MGDRLQHLYQQTAAEEGDAQAGASSAPNDEEVVDAEIVDEQGA